MPSIAPSNTCLVAHRTTALRAIEGLEEAYVPDLVRMSFSDTAGEISMSYVHRSLRDRPLA